MILIIKWIQEIPIITGNPPRIWNWDLKWDNCYEAQKDKEHGHVWGKYTNLNGSL